MIKSVNPGMTYRDICSTLGQLWSSSSVEECRQRQHYILYSESEREATGNTHFDHLVPSSKGGYSDIRQQNYPILSHNNSSMINRINRLKETTTGVCNGKEKVDAFYYSLTIE